MLISGLGIAAGAPPAQLVVDDDTALACRAAARGRRVRPRQPARRNRAGRGVRSRQAVAARAVRRADRPPHRRPRRHGGHCRERRRSKRPAPRSSGGSSKSGLERIDEVSGRARWVNLIGRTDLPLVAAVMASCRVFVSNDSGAMHLAAAAGARVVALFGPTIEEETAPLPPGVHKVLTAPVWCRPCMLRECPIDHRCMTGITVERVAEAVAGL